MYTRTAALAACPQIQIACGNTPDNHDGSPRLLQNMLPGTASARTLLIDSVSQQKQDSRAAVQAKQIETAY